MKSKQFMIGNIIAVVICMKIHVSRTGNNDNGGGGSTESTYKHDSSVRSLKAKEIQKVMNLNADPCHDFFEYACGNWPAAHSYGKEAISGTAGTAGTITPQQQIIGRTDYDLKKLIDEQIRLEDSNCVRKLKSFYKSCINANRNDQHSQQFVSDFIKINGGFPAVPGSNWMMHHYSYDWVQIVSQLRKNYGMNILIGLNVDTNYANVHENSIYLREPTTIIPTQLCNSEAVKRIDVRDQDYEGIEKEVADNLSHWLALDAMTSKRVAADIITFEFELCGGVRSEAQQLNDALNNIYEKTYLRKNLIEFTHVFQDKIDFNEFVTNSFGTAIYKPVYMETPNYFHHLIKTIAAFNKATVANYIMYRALSYISFPLDDHPHRRGNYCLQIVKRYFPRTLGALYERQYSNENAKADIMLIFDQLKTAFEQSLHEAWIEEGTSRAGIKKLHDITLRFPKYDRETADDLPIDSINYWRNLVLMMGLKQTDLLKRISEDNQLNSDMGVEAFDVEIIYRIVQKRIDMGWAMLQAPFFHAAYGNSVRYATIGHRVATQLATAFDDLNWSLNLLERNSWDAWTAAAYRNRSNCFMQQLSNYLYNDGLSFRDRIQLRQLIAQSSGLNIAFNAYLNWLHFQRPNNDFAVLTKETLPELNYSNTQLFFIAYAQTHCTNTRNRSDDAFIYSAQQLHNIERYYVNGPLRNLREFALEFNCKIGTAMNPDSKCVIY